MCNFTKTIEKNILATVCYFDVFDYPLTSFEIYQYLPKGFLGLTLIRENSFEEIKDILSGSSWLNNRLGFKSGFYFLKEREELVETRLKRYKIAHAKYKKSKRIAKIFSYFPFIKMICVCNTLAYSNSKDCGDLDFFLVVKNRRIWSARFFMVVFLDIFGLRPKKGNEKNKVCLSFLVTEHSLDISQCVKLPYDPYYYYWCAGLVPVYEQKNYYLKFLQKNSWLRNFLPNYIKRNTASQRKLRKKENIFKNIIEKILSGKAGDMCESFLKKFQLKRMNDIIIQKSQDPKEVILSDRMLKFHVNDQRDHFRLLFEKNYEKNSRA